MQVNIHTDVLHGKLAVAEGRSERQWTVLSCNLCDSRQSTIAVPEVAIGQVSWVRNSEGSLRNICVLS